MYVHCSIIKDENCDDDISWVTDLECMLCKQFGDLRKDEKTNAGWLV